MSDDKDLKIVKLSDHDDRSITWPVADMLDDAKEVIKENPQYKKALLILLDDEGRNYTTRPLCAGIGSTSEVVALLDIEKTRQKKKMGIYD